VNPYNETDRNRLFKAMEWSYRQLEPFRRLVSRLVEEYAGSGYGQPGARPRYEILLNLMNQAVDAYTMSLVANRPRIMVGTRNSELLAFAKHFEIALNNLIQEIELEVVLRQAVMDAFFCVGIVKVHMADSIQVQVEEGLWMDPGTPAASNIALDNWVHDMAATRYDKVKFARDCYRIPFSDLQAAPFDQGEVRKLSPSSKSYLERGEERLDAITQGTSTDRDEFEPMIDLQDVWVPRDGKIYTWAVGPNQFTCNSGPVAVMDWDGPEFGPYHILSYNDVPENIMPTSPASHLAGLSRLINSLMRKQRKRAEAQKRVHTYTPAGVQGAKNVQSAADDDFREVQDPNEIKTVVVGGIDPQTQAFMLGTMEMFDRMAGNLSAMMGLGAQAETLGQERLIYGAVSKKEAMMQYRTIDFSRRIIRDLGHLLWHDAFKAIPGEMEVPGADGYRLRSDWTPEDREGNFFDYQLDIDVYSMPYQSPMQRLQAINTLLTQIWIPLAPMLAQQGGYLDFEKLSAIQSDLLNEPRLREIVKFGSPTPEPGAATEGPPKPGSTTRNYVRRNVPTGGTMEGRRHVAQQSWMDRAGQVNADQSAMLAQGA